VQEANAYRNSALAGGRITGASPSVTNAVGKKLENIIESDPAMLGEALMILGRQVKTDSGKVIDLLGIDAEGGVHVLELKRDRTPRDVVAQILDYGSWVEQLSQKQIRDIYDHYRADGPS
jgi:RecB family endonuclease NucS